MDHTYSIQEVAAKLNLSDKTLRRWEDAGKFRSSRTLGNQRRYSIEDIQILDAIKHGTINSQSELLSLEQAANFCGVSKATFSRWEDEGKIHPLITSGNTYYPQNRLLAKLSSLPRSTEPELPPREPMQLVEEEVEMDTEEEEMPAIFNEPAAPAPKLPPLTTPPAPQYEMPSNIRSTITHTLITILIVLGYHLAFNSTPQTTIQDPGSVKGATTAAPTPDPRLDDLIAKFKEHVKQQTLKDAKPLAPTTINLDGTSYVTSSYVLPAGQDQVSVTSDKITATTPVVVSFSMDYSPAKKYWVTMQDGGFTLHTDFPVAVDTTFNYSFISTKAPITPTPTLSTPAPASPSAKR